MNHQGVTPSQRRTLSGLPKPALLASSPDLRLTPASAKSYGVASSRLYSFVCEAVVGICRCGRCCPFGGRRTADRLELEAKTLAPRWATFFTSRRIGGAVVSARRW